MGCEKHRRLSARWLEAGGFSGFQSTLTRSDTSAHHDLTGSIEVRGTSTSPWGQSRQIVSMAASSAPRIATIPLGVATAASCM